MLRLRIGPVLVFLLLILSNLSSAQRMGRETGLPSVNLSVRVTWDGDHPARLHLCVRLVTEGGATLASGYTDVDGRVTLGLVSSGNYRIQISGDEIQDQEEQVYIYPGDTDQVEIVHVRAKETQSGVSPPRTPATVAVVDLNVPKKARKEVNKGNQEAKKKDWKAAEQHFRAAIQEYPRYAMAYNNLGAVLFQGGDVAGAREAFEKALEINDHYSHAYVNLGHLLYDQGDDANVEKLMQKALAADPRNLDALLVLASAELREGKFALSADTALEVHDLQRVDCVPPCPPEGTAATDHLPAAHFIAGKALALSHRLRAAAQQFKLYLAETPDGPLAAQARAELTSLEKDGAAPAQ